eukprot:TRINITY_DN10866_c0_g1_i1.p2 TRINITY_DN10866_c0_g1~~TRINITY_DN10866_c0_g1_i1.p2  ORF type:complete len:196 (-),score=46.30 TRINITY_DN10866_c0_g1_i1:38-625(-)
MIELWVVRHGERVDHKCKQWRAGPCERQFDPPLTPAGARMASATAARLARETAVVEKQPRTLLLASPFVRALATSAPIAACFGVPISIENGLSEGLRANHEFTGQPVLLTSHEAEAYLRAEIAPLCGISASGVVVDHSYQSVSQFPTFPEPRVAYFARYKETVRKILDKYPGYQRIIFVTHGCACCHAFFFFFFI